VGTVTEIYDYLRLLFANLGVRTARVRARDHGAVAGPHHRDGDAVPERRADQRAGAIVRGRKGEFRKELAALRSRGFTRVRVDGELRPLETTSSSTSGATTPSRWSWIG